MRPDLARTSVALLAAATLASCSRNAPPKGAAPAAALPEYALRLSEDLVFEVDPRLELLAAVQSRTDWVGGERGPRAPNRYFEELSAFAEPWSKSAAARRSRALGSTGFSSDAPCALALSLDGGEALLAPVEGWSPYLRRRAFLAFRLDAFRSALADFYAASGFRSFLAAHEADYRRWIAEASEGFDAAAVSAWLDSFYAPREKPAYHFVLAPAMFPAGGYGFSRALGEGASRRLHVYQVVRAQGAEGGEPGFPSGRGLASLTLHEFSHSFVNPALEPVSRDRRLRAIYAPVSARMRRMAYGAADLFLNELVIRAATILGERELGLATPLEEELELRAEEALGFYPVRRVLALLEEYRAGLRGGRGDFAAFAPALLGRLAEESAAIVAEGSRRGFAGGAGSAAPAAGGFSEGFEGASGDFGIPAGWELALGARSPGGDGSASRARVEAAAEAGAAARGGSVLALEADSRTSSWLVIQRPLAVEEGTLALRWSARGEGIRAEGRQFGGSYVGLVLEMRDGSRRFAVRGHEGSFPWKEFSLEEPIDPAKIASIRCAIFLNESGRLWVDDLEAAYR